MNELYVQLVDGMRNKGKCANIPAASIREILFFRIKKFVKCGTLRKRVGGLHSTATHAHLVPQKFSL